LRINDRLKQSIEDKDRLKIDIRVVYRKDDLRPDEHNWFETLRSTRLKFLPDLHAKCYLNEKEAIVTSMNLYEHSQVHNHEMGIYVNREEDAALYKDIYEEAKRLDRSSDEVKISVLKVPKDTEKNGKLPTNGSGFCIRCGDAIKLNPTAPYCKKCYSAWKKYENAEYEEKHCHICGKPNKSMLTKPSCYDCYKAKKGVLEFPLSAP